MPSATVSQDDFAERFSDEAAEADDAVFEKIYGRSLTAEDVST
jgi:hypothetical protein